jgi:hypothetical protein
MRGAGCAALVVAAMGGGGVRSTIAHAAPAEGAALAQAFGARVAVSDMSMSPDGTHVAFIVPDGAGQQVMVADLVAGGTPRSVLASPRAGEKLLGVRGRPTSACSAGSGSTKPMSGRRSAMRAWWRSTAMAGI